MFAKTNNNHNLMAIFLNLISSADSAGPY